MATQSPTSNRSSPMSLASPVAETSAWQKVMEPTVHLLAIKLKFAASVIKWTFIGLNIENAAQEASRYLAKLTELRNLQPVFKSIEGQEIVSDNGLAKRNPKNGKVDFNKEIQQIKKLQKSFSQSIVEEIQTRNTDDFQQAETEVLNEVKLFLADVGLEKLNIFEPEYDRSQRQKIREFAYMTKEEIVRGKLNEEDSRFITEAFRKQLASAGIYVTAAHFSRQVRLVSAEDIEKELQQ